MSRVINFLRSLLRASGFAALSGRKDTASSTSGVIRHVDGAFPEVLTSGPPSPIILSRWALSTKPSGQIGLWPSTDAKGPSARSASSRRASQVATKSSSAQSALEMEIEFWNSQHSNPNPSSSRAS